MIRFENVSKRYRLRRGVKTILKRADFVIPRGKNLGVLGFNGAGKSTLIRLISGNELPDSGWIHRDGVTISWPLGFSDSFSGSLSGRENLRFACRVYNKSIAAVTRYVDEFAELGNQLDMPVKTYSSGMKARLAFGMSMAFNFDVYLIDELTAVGDKTFQAKCNAAFQEKLERSDIIMVSHSTGTIKKHCQTGCILDGGTLEFFPTIEEAIAVYDEMTKERS